MNPNEKIIFLKVCGHNYDAGRQDLHLCHSHSPQQDDKTMKVTLLYTSTLCC